MPRLVKIKVSVKDLFNNIYLQIPLPKANFAKVYLFTDIFHENIKKYRQQQTGLIKYNAHT